MSLAGWVVGARGVGWADGGMGEGDSQFQNKMPCFKSPSFDSLLMFAPMGSILALSLHSDSVSF